MRSSWKENNNKSILKKNKQLQVKEISATGVISVGCSVASVSLFVGCFEA
jgi:hypothetical protein